MADKRSAAHERLRVGFLANAFDTLADLHAQWADDPTEEVCEAIASDVGRIGQTAGALGLTEVERAAEALSSALSAGAPPPFTPLIQSLRDIPPVDHLRPIAVVSDGSFDWSRVDDGEAEQLIVVDSVEALRTELAIAWPSVIVVPIDDVDAVSMLSTHFRAPVLVYGPPDNGAARIAAAEEGAKGYLAAPLAYRELRAEARWWALRTLSPAQVLWAAPLSDEHRGQLWAAEFDVRPLQAGESIASVFESEYPEVVVVADDDPESRALTLSMLRSLGGRSFVPLVALTDDAANALDEGWDDAVSPTLTTLAHRLQTRRARFDAFVRGHNEFLGVPNRVGALADLRRLVALSRREGRPVAVVVATLDGLTEVRASHGRGVANMAARRFAQLLTQSLRREDLVGYLGGDRFLALLPNCPIEGARMRMNSIGERFAAANSGDPRVAGLTLVAGIADSEDGVPGLLRRAQAELLATLSHG